MAKSGNQGRAVRLSKLIPYELVIEKMYLAWGEGRRGCIVFVDNDRMELVRVYAGNRRLNEVPKLKARLAAMIAADKRAEREAMKRNGR